MASPGPCHGQRASGPLQEAGRPPNLSQPLSHLPAPPQQRPSCSERLPTGLFSCCYRCRGHATVPLSPSWEATLNWLQLCYRALGTAEGERLSSASFLLFWRTLCRKLPEGQAVDVSNGEAASARCSWLALLPVSSPQGREQGGRPWGILAAERAHTSPAPICCSPVGRPSPRAPPEKWWQGRDTHSYNKQHVPVRILTLSMRSGGKKC